MSEVKARAESFCKRFGLRVPILLAPMAGACPPSLSVAVANAGGLGACGALLLQPEEIIAWSKEVRENSNGAFQLNIWIPDPPPQRDLEHEARIREFLAQWGPPVPPDAGDPKGPDFLAQCEAMLAAGPPILSSIMGLYAPHGLPDEVQRKLTAAVQKAAKDPAVVDKLEGIGLFPQYEDPAAARRRLETEYRDIIDLSKQLQP